MSDKTKISFSSENQRSVVKVLSFQSESTGGIYRRLVKTLGEESFREIVIGEELNCRPKEHKEGDYTVVL